MKATGKDMTMLEDFVKNYELNEPLEIDSSYFDVNYLGDKDLVSDMLKMFLNNTPLLLTQVREYYQNQNWKQLYQYVHKIKPTFTMIGLQKVSVICEYIESHVKDDQQEKDIEMLNDFITLLENKGMESLRLAKVYLESN